MLNSVNCSHVWSCNLFTFPDPDSEKFFTLLSNTQDRRLDDQRASLLPLPGIQNGGGTSASGAAGMDTNHLCYMVSKVQVGPILYGMWKWDMFFIWYCSYRICLEISPTTSIHVAIYRHRDQGWMNRDALHPKSYRISVPHLLSTKNIPIQTTVPKLTNISRWGVILLDTRLIVLNASTVMILCSFNKLFYQLFFCFICTWHPHNSGVFEPIKQRLLKTTAGPVLVFRPGLCVSIDEQLMRV